MLTAPSISKISRAMPGRPCSSGRRLQILEIDIAVNRGGTDVGLSTCGSKRTVNIFFVGSFFLYVIVCYFGRKLLLFGF